MFLNLNVFFFQLKAIYPIIIDSSKNMINFINQQISSDNKKAFDIHDVSARFTCDVCTSATLGFEAKSFESEKPEVFELGHNIMKGITESVQGLFPKKMVPKKYEDAFIQLVTDAIKSRIENKIERDDFLSHIIATKERKGQTDDEAAAHGWTFFLDAFETSGIVAHLVIYEVANNKEVQDRLREEIVENLDQNGSISYEKLLELPYLDQVFYEALRLHPPFMFTTKVCSEDLEIDGIKGHKFTMKKGSTALISFHSIQRDPGELFVAF
jgi:cytochrome P450